MKFVLLLTFVAVCTASTLYRGKNVVFKDDGTIEITQHGKRITINPITGQKKIEIEVGGGRRVSPQQILIDPRNEINGRTYDRLDEELRESHQFGDRSRHQADILAEIFKNYEGGLDEEQFDQLLQRIDEAVKRGEVNSRIYDLLDRFGRDRSSEEDQEEEEVEEEVEERKQSQQILCRRFPELCDNRRVRGGAQDYLGWLNRIPKTNLGYQQLSTRPIGGITTDILRQVQQLGEICNRLVRLQQQRPTTNIIEQAQRQQELANIIDSLQRQIQARQVQLGQCLQTGVVGFNLRQQQQQISCIVDLLQQQQQQIQFEQTETIPGLTAWQQQQQIANTINGLQQLLQQQEECQQIKRAQWGRFGGFSRLQQEQQEREAQQLLEQQQPFGLTGPRRQIEGLLPWQQVVQQQRIEQLLAQQGRQTQFGPWQQQQLLKQQQLQEPLIIGMTEQVEPFRGSVDTDGLTEIVGARVGDQVVFHTLPLSSRRPLPSQSSLVDLTRRQFQTPVVQQALRQREILEGPQPIQQEFVY